MPSRSAPLAVLAVVAVFATSLLGCSTGGDEAIGPSTTAADADPSPSTEATDPPPSPDDSADPGDSGDADADDAEPTDATAPAALLEQLAIADEDLVDGETSELREQGLQVVNQITLDYCGFTFTTEKERLFRHQVNVYLDETYVASSEAVLYSPGSAEKAMDEVRQAISECPAGVATNSRVAGVPDLIYEAEPLPADLLTSLADDHIAVHVTASTTDGRSQDTTMIYQRRGDVLIGTYGQQHRAVPLAEAVARRLAAASPADVGD